MVLEQGAHSWRPFHPQCRQQCCQAPATPCCSVLAASPTPTSAIETRVLDWGVTSRALCNWEEMDNLAL